MKKILSIIIAFALILTPATTTQAKNTKPHGDSQIKNSCIDYQDEYSIRDSYILRYGKYKLPIDPIEDGMGASVSFKRSKAQLTITKDAIKININFKSKKVSVNNVTDWNSGIFTARDNKKMSVLIKYIAGILGYNIQISGDNITITGPGNNEPGNNVPGLDRPTNVTLTPVGGVVLANTINSTNTYLSALAYITAGEATGGRAELYVSSKLIAVDSVITATDNVVTFTTSDGTPTNAELQAILPSGGLACVKLYDSYGNNVISNTANPTLTVDYSAPTISSVISAEYKPAENKLIINTNGCSSYGDIVDITKLSLIDYTLGKTYQLTGNSYGTVINSNTLTITIGSADKIGLNGFGSSLCYLNIAAGSLIKDAAGNTSNQFSTNQLIPVNLTSISTAMDAPSNITLASDGLVEVPNTLNSTSIYFAATAKIIPGQVTGGRAELYVGSRLVATDNSISVADNQVSFTTSDGTPTNAKLQAVVPVGGVVSVKLYNAYGNYVTSTASNPTLTVDYIVPTLSGIISAFYDMSTNQLSIITTGAGQYGDSVDVTKLSLYDMALNKTYQLTNYQSTGSTGTVLGSTTLLVNIGLLDRAGMTGFGSSMLYLSVVAGSLLKDTAGNVSPALAAQFIPVTVANYPVTALNAPTNVTVNPVGINTVGNSLNLTTLYMDATAKITAGQATGGKAELYVAGKLIATDSNISSADTSVTFSTSDGTPTNAELQAMIPYGGVVTVKLYNSNNVTATSSVGNPILTTDYIAPTITKVTSASYDMTNAKIYLYVEGAGAVGDLVDVSKIGLYDTVSKKYCQLTDAKEKGSSGTVSSSNLLIITIGAADKSKMTGIGKGTVYLAINSGSLIKDTAGNTSPYAADKMSFTASVYR